VSSQTTDQSDKLATDEIKKATHRSELFRSLPSVDQMLDQLAHLDSIPRALITNEVRSVLDERRARISSGQQLSDQTVAHEVEARLRTLLRPSLRRVINATGVILHTNLGRAPLTHFESIPGYSNLEYDLAAGKRGKRDAHCQPLLRRLLGQEAIVVNNNAAAVFLVLHELAQGGEVIVSRGELIEIGDGFRIPEIMSRSGAVLREVGTTNRTRIEDYRDAINERTRAIMRVHPSNFHTSGFVGRPTLHELVGLGKERGIPVYEDLGSGCLVDLKRFGFTEPLVSESFTAGVPLVSFSCDKLLGGPQSGIIAGDAGLVDRVRRNPMYRAFRVDKLVIEALETTLRHLLTENWEALPALRMIAVSSQELRLRAERMAIRLSPLEVHMAEGKSAAGGGSTPDQTLPTWLVQIAVPSVNGLEHRLRQAPVPVIARIEKDMLTLDLRTVASDEEESLIASIRYAL
jgi:L-seryl-tRNA(Ser) seleniumtransferase